MSGKRVIVEGPFEPKTIGELIEVLQKFDPAEELWLDIGMDGTGAKSNDGFLIDRAYFEEVPHPGPMPPSQNHPPPPYGDKDNSLRISWVSNVRDHEYSKEWTRPRVWFRFDECGDYE